MTIQEYRKQREEELEKEWADYVSKIIIANNDAFLLDTQALCRDWWLARHSETIATVLDMVREVCCTTCKDMLESANEKIKCK